MTHPEVPGELIKMAVFACHDKTNRDDKDTVAGWRLVGARRANAAGLSWIVVPTFFTADAITLRTLKPPGKTNCNECTLCIRVPGRVPHWRQPEASYIQFFLKPFLPNCLRVQHASRWKVAIPFLQSANNRRYRGGPGSKINDRARSKTRGCGAPAKRSKFIRCHQLRLLSPSASR